MPSLASKILTPVRIRMAVQEIFGCKAAGTLHVSVYNFTSLIGHKRSSTSLRHYATLPVSVRTGLIRQHRMAGSLRVDANAGGSIVMVVPAALVAVDENSRPVGASGVAVRSPPRFDQIINIAAFPAANGF